MPFLYELIITRLQSYRSTSTPEPSALQDKPSDPVSPTSSNSNTSVCEDMPLSNTTGVTLGSDLPGEGLPTIEVVMQHASSDSISVASDDSMDDRGGSDSEGSDDTGSELDDLDLEDGVQYEGRIKTKADLRYRVESVSGCSFMVLSLGETHI